MFWNQVLTYFVKEAWEHLVSQTFSFAPVFFIFALKRFLFLHIISKKNKRKKGNATAREVIKRRTTPYEGFFSCRHKKREQEKVQRDEGGVKEKRKHLFGLRLHKRRPWALQQIAQDPAFFFKSLALNCQAPISPLLHFSFHVDTGNDSDKLFFIFYYVRVWLRCIVRQSLVGRKKPSQDQRPETQPGVTQTGGVGGEGYEVRDE